MAMTFTQLVGEKSVTGSIKSWVNYASLPAEDCLLEAEGAIYALLRVKEMEATAEVAVAEGAITATKPTGYLDPITLFDNWNDELRLWDSPSLIKAQAKDESGSYVRSYPSRWAFFDEQLNFNCAAIEALTYRMLYYKQPAALSAEAPTNFLTSRYPHLIRPACLMIAADFMDNDTKYARYKSRLAEMAAVIMQGDDLAMRGSSPQASYEYEQ